MNKINRLILIFFPLIFFNISFSYAKIKTVEVTTSGIGISQQDAIRDAIKNAIEQVNGAAVAAQSAVSMKSVSKVKDNSKSVEMTKKYMKDIITASKGVIQGYEILSSKQNPKMRDLFDVKLKVKVAKFKKSKQLQRLRMAVSNFYITKDAIKNRSSLKFATNTQDKIIDLLTQTRRFAILDRQFLKDQQKELNFINSPDVSTEELAKLGNKAGTDYLITAVLKNLKKVTTKKTMKSTGKVFKKTTFSAELSFRIIDVATTQVKFADTISTTVGSNYKNLRNRLSDKVAETILNAIYPIRVVGVSGKNITLGQGGKSIKKNAKYNLVKLGERIIDPYTKESLGRKEIQIGTVTITDVQSKMSTAKIVKSKIKDVDELLKYDFIVRPMKSVSYGTLSKEKKYKKLKKEIDKDFKKLKEKSKDDW